MDDYRPALDTALARFDQFTGRLDRGELKPAAAARPKLGTAAQARRLANAGIGVALLIVATILFGFIVGPIGLGGLMVVGLVIVALIAAMTFWPGAAPKPVAPFREEMNNKAVVQRLGSVLSRGRAALPAPATQRVDAIQAQLPLIESKLEALSPLDPLAQDARRLMGQHLPELIERYEKVPAQYRRERDGDGMSVDDRLVSGLEAARVAVDDISRKLAEQDVDAFEVQGRFLESRYKDDAPGLDR
jgi:hypothetical protein